VKEAKVKLRCENEQQYIDVNAVMAAAAKAYFKKHTRRGNILDSSEDIYSQVMSVEACELIKKIGGLH